jgi:hypothetical protein
MSRKILSSEDFRVCFTTVSFQLQYRALQKLAQDPFCK